MSEFVMERLKETLESLIMKNTLEILDNYLERAVKDNLNIAEVLDHIFTEETVSNWGWLPQSIAVRPITSTATT